MSRFYLKHTKKTISAVLLAGAASSSLVSANTGNLVLTKTGANEDLAETNANKDEPAKEAGIQGGEGSGGYVYAGRQNTKDSTSSQSGLKVLSLDPKTLLSILLASSSTASLNSLAKNLFAGTKPEGPKETDDPVNPPVDPDPTPTPVDPPKPTEKRKKSSNSKLWHLLWLLLIPVGIVLFKCRTPLFIKVFGWDYYLKKFKSWATTASDKITECIELCHKYKKLLVDEELNKYINSFKVKDLTWDECSELNNIFTDKANADYVKGIDSKLKNAIKEKANIESAEDDGEYVKKTVASYSSVKLLNLQQLNKLLTIFENNKDNESWLKEIEDIDNFKNNVKKEFVKKHKEKDVKSLKFIELSHLICILEDENNEQWLKDIEDVSTFKQGALNEFADDLKHSPTCDKLNEDFVKLTYQKYKATYPVSWWRIFEDKRGIYNSLHFSEGIDVDTLAKDLEALKEHVPEQYKGRVGKIAKSIKNNFEECKKKLEEYKNAEYEKYIKNHPDNWWELYTPEFVDKLNIDTQEFCYIFEKTSEFRRNAEAENPASGLYSEIVSQLSKNEAIAAQMKKIAEFDFSDAFFSTTDSKLEFKISEKMNVDFIDFMYGLFPLVSIVSLPEIKNKKQAICNLNVLSNVHTDDQLIIFTLEAPGGVNDPTILKCVINSIKDVSDDKYCKEVKAYLLRRVTLFLKLVEYKDFVIKPCIEEKVKNEYIEKGKDVSGENAKYYKNKARCELHELDNVKEELAKVLKILKEKDLNTLKSIDFNKDDKIFSNASNLVYFPKLLKN